LPYRIAKLGALLGAAVIALPATAGAATPSGGTLYAGDFGGATVTADGSSLTAPLGAMLGGTLRFRGTLSSSRPGDTVVVQRLDPRRGWQTTATTTVAPDGSFLAAWRADRAGRTTVRAVHGDTGTATAAQAATTAPTRSLTVYRPAVATWYGPGFYGRRTACGQKMSRRLLGVAHRTLRCGTLVEVFYGGRAITVPVVDRGPFRRGTTWDLTSAAARALGVRQTTTVGTVRAAPAK
jgi:hypothetical protein